MQQQVLEQVVLAAGQAQRCTGEDGPAGAAVQVQVAVDEDAGAHRRGGGPAEHGGDPQGQLARAEGLGDVVVGAELEPTDTVVLLAERGEEHDREVRSLRLQLAADRQAVPAGQHEVEDDHVGCPFQRLVRGFLRTPATPPPRASAPYVRLRPRRRSRHDRDGHRPTAPRDPSIGSPLPQPHPGPWLTAVLGVVLLVGLPVVAVTGLLDYVAYGPGQQIPGDVGLLRPPDFVFPSDPPWLFRLTQGVHVGLGLVLIPVVLAKLWSVLPALFVFPPVRSVAHLLERLSLLLLVGSILFEIVTGVLNIQYDYVFGFSFYTAHLPGRLGVHGGLRRPRGPEAPRGGPRPAVPVVAGRAAHTAVPDTSGGDRRRSRRGTPGRTDHEQAGRPGRGGRRLTADRRAHGGADRGAAASARVPAAAGGGFPDGPPGNDFPVNRTAAAAGIDRAAVDPEVWRLELVGGPAPVVLDRAGLLAGGARLPLHTATLPLACVEGWSAVRTWTGVRLRDLAALAGVPTPASAVVTSFDPGGFGRAAVPGPGSSTPTACWPCGWTATTCRSTTASRHGHHPLHPGVHCTKWVRSIEFRRV
ncbi:hypothetical protein L7F22_069182 [Adiantum nelumboides]|nr:hypothetical protein [Adiantum nelumboides]